MKRLVAILAIFAAALLCAPKGSAQEETYKFDFGGQIGMSGYLGDANQSNLLKHPGVGAGLTFRYLANTRMALRVAFNTLSLSGNTADFEDYIPGGEPLKFSSQVYELSARYEFNFFAYGIGETYKKLKRWSPYLAVGVGVALAACDDRTSFAPTIPMAVGIKYKIKERLNISMEFAMTKAFGDHIDGPLSDLYQIKSAFMKNTDWYSNLSVSVTYEFGKRCVTCHYVD